MSSIVRVLTNKELCRRYPRTFSLALLSSSFTPASVFPNSDAMQLLALRAVVSAAAVSRRQVCRPGARTNEDVLAAAALERSCVSVLTFTRSGIALAHGLIPQRQVLPARQLPRHELSSHPRALRGPSLEHRPAVAQGVAAG